MKQGTESQPNLQGVTVLRQQEERVKWTDPGRTVPLVDPRPPAAVTKRGDETAISDGSVGRKGSEIGGRG